MNLYEISNFLQELLTIQHFVVHIHHKLLKQNPFKAKPWGYLCSENTLEFQYFQMEKDETKIIAFSYTSSMKRTYIKTFWSGPNVPVVSCNSSFRNTTRGEELFVYIILPAHIDLQLIYTSHTRIPLKIGWNWQVTAQRTETELLHSRQAKQVCMQDRNQRKWYVISATAHQVSSDNPQK